MIGFEVTLNGERVCTAAAGATGVLTAGVTWALRTAPGVANPSDISLRVGGLSSDAHLDWPIPRKLRVGDVVAITIVETDAPDPPARTKRDDPALVEEAERLSYERLKTKYGQS
jgi:hypothetical protein